MPVRHPAPAAARRAAAQLPTASRRSGAERDQRVRKSARETFSQGTLASARSRGSGSSSSVSATSSSIPRGAAPRQQSLAFDQSLRSRRRRRRPRRRRALRSIVSTAGGGQSSRASGVIDHAMASNEHVCSVRAPSSTKLSATRTHTAHSNAFVTVHARTSLRLSPAVRRSHCGAAGSRLRILLSVFHTFCETKNCGT